MYAYITSPHHWRQTTTLISKGEKTRRRVKLLYRSFFYFSMFFFILLRICDDIFLIYDALYEGVSEKVQTSANTKKDPEISGFDKDRHFNMATVPSSLHFFRLRGANQLTEGPCCLVMTSSFCAGGCRQCCKLPHATATALRTGWASFCFWIKLEWEVSRSTHEASTGFNLIFWIFPSTR